jgi:glycosidase
MKHAIGSFGLLLLLALLGPEAGAQTVELVQRDATVWGREQVVRGVLSGATAGALFVNDEEIPFEAPDGTFAVVVVLDEGESEVVACAAQVCSDPLLLTLGYQLRPEVALTASVAAREVTLEGRLLANPEGGAVSFAWAQDPDNPQALALSILTDTTAAVSVPTDAAPGEYYFDLTASDEDGDAQRARTYVTVSAEGVTPFDIAADHAAWIDQAVLYEITPRFFTNQFNGRLDHITQRIPEFVELGINTIWLQPIFETFNGQQAYDVTDYFAVWDALGTEEDLHELIGAAHAAGLKVILDFVPNHTSIQHPYAQQAIEAGADSYYYDFYQREEDDAPYSENYQTMQVGAMTFVYYFWEDLVNLDYHNPDVQRFIVEASRYWVETFDVDGYRMDAVWGVVARNPAFVQAWRRALKRVKPEILFLGETKATDPVNFDERFDAAYDWDADPGYISRWAWQRSGQEETIFNTGLDRFRARDLRNALTNDGNGYAPNATILRYIENNDTPRFADNHSVEQTKMAAALAFSLPGIPMLYYGQEVGVTNQFPSFPLSLPISSYDDDGFFPHYQHLIRLRQQFSALTSDHYAEVAVTPEEVAGQTFAFRRWAGVEGGTENVFAVLNMGADAVAAELTLPVDEIGVEPEGVYYLTDLFTGTPREVTGQEIEALSVEVSAHTTRLFVLADSVVAVPTPSEPAPASAPTVPMLAQNYPNPFAAQTVIEYRVGEPGRVRLSVFDVLGREVAVLVDDVAAPGLHRVRFDAQALPNGVYVYRLITDSSTQTRRLMLIR